MDGFLGIDISKNTFDAALIIEDKIKTKKFSNNLSGFNTLSHWITKQQVTVIQACMEATSVYTQKLTAFLYQRNIAVSVVNPARIKGFAQSEMSRSKNDKQDAKIIARFCKLIRPKLWQPTPEDIVFLQQWVRRLDDLKSMCRQEENRLGTASTFLLAHIHSNISNLKNQIKEVKLIIKNHIHNNQRLKRKSELLRSIPGIGESTVAQVLAFIGDTNQFKNAKEVSAFIGLNPRHRQSGTSLNGKARLSKMGNSALRKAFYMPAVVSMRYNPIIKKFCKRLEVAGKHKMLMIGAAMRKLVHIIYGVLKSETMFDANILNCA